MHTVYNRTVILNTNRTIFCALSGWNPQWLLDVKLGALSILGVMAKYPEIGQFCGLGMSLAAISFFGQLQRNWHSWRVWVT